MLYVGGGPRSVLGPPPAKSAATWILKSKHERG